jgi:hypothetical protein
MTALWRRRFALAHLAAKEQITTQMPPIFAPFRTDPRPDARLLRQGELAWRPQDRDKLPVVRAKEENRAHETTHRKNAVHDRMDGVLRFSFSEGSAFARKWRFSGGSTNYSQDSPAIAGLFRRQRLRC